MMLLPSEGPDVKIRTAWFGGHPVCTDTRKIRPGDMFFALSGEHFDGNQFAAQALEAGAALAVVDDPAVVPDADPRYILVPDALQQLQLLARDYRRTFAVPVLAITGSNGKTTTKELVYQVLSQRFRTFATPGNLNNHIGVPLSIMQVPSDTELIVLELGDNHPGEIALLCEICEPTHGLITNVGEDHLEFFGTMDAVEAAKAEMTTYIAAHGGLMLENRHDPRVHRICARVPRRVAFGTPDAEVSLADADFGLHASHLTIQVCELAGNERIHPSILEIRTPLIGEHNAENIQAAVLAGFIFGIADADIRKGIEGYTPTNNRSQWVRKGNTDIFLDAYNANPSSMRFAMQAVMRDTGKKTGLVLGDMFELGEQAPGFHREIGDRVNLLRPAFTLFVGPLMAQAAAVCVTPHVWVADTETARSHFEHMLSICDVLLIKGSRGIALEKLLK